jgi:DNA-binding transcriptional LysR family regulator
LDLKKLQYFLTVAEEGHITKAAKRLNIAQPPLSHQLKVLEQELGVQLMQKVGRNIQLTEAGHTLHTRGEQILELVKTVEKELQDVYKGEIGTLSIGSATSWGATFLSEQIAEYNLQYPNIQFRICEDVSHKIASLLADGVIELGIILSPFNTELYEAISMPAEPLIAVMTNKWDDQPSRQDTSLTELAKKPLIIHRRSERLLVYYQEHKLEPKIVCIHDDVRSMLLLANAGLGVAIVSKTITRMKFGDHLIYKEITNPGSHLTPYIIWMRNRNLSAAARNFVKMITQK